MDCDNCNCVNKCADASVADILDPAPTSEPILEEILDFVPNTGDLLVSEINIPEKINIDSSDILPSLEELVKNNFSQPETTNTNKNLSAEEMQKVMSNIEKTANFSNPEEGLAALDNPAVIFTRIQNAFDTFKEQTGRNMTYSEMRYMMG